LIALASYRGREGHPMLFARPLFDKLMGLHGDKAAWKLVDANPGLVRVIPFDRPFPEDIDTVEDFQRVTKNDERHTGEKKYEISRICSDEKPMSPSAP